MIFGSIVCACAGSTTGGIKVNRALIAAKTFKQRVQQQQHPNAIFRVRIDGVTQESDTLHTVSIFIVFYLFMILVGTIASTLFGLDIVTSFTASVACMGNVGPGFGEVGSMDNYSSMPTFVKGVMSLLMLLGRLEIFGLIQLFLIKWWR